MHVLHVISRGCYAQHQPTYHFSVAIVTHLLGMVWLLFVTLDTRNDFARFFRALDMRGGRYSTLVAAGTEASTVALLGLVAVAAVD